VISSINSFVAPGRRADLQRVVGRRRAVVHLPLTSGSTSTTAPDVALRLAVADEADVIRRLADLDDAPVLEGQVLLALIDGQAVAALSLRDGRVVANPFLPTAETVALLRLRAEQLSGESPRRRLRGILSPRFA
jgi:hypothetical protein